MIRNFFSNKICQNSLAVGISIIFSGVLAQLPASAKRLVISDCRYNSCADTFFVNRKLIKNNKLGKLYQVSFDTHHKNGISKYSPKVFCSTKKPLLLNNFKTENRNDLIATLINPGELPSSASSEHHYALYWAACHGGNVSWGTTKQDAVKFGYPLNLRQYTIKFRNVGEFDNFISNTPKIARTEPVNQSKELVNKVNVNWNDLKYQSDKLDKYVMSQRGKFDSLKIPSDLNIKLPNGLIYSRSDKNKIGEPIILHGVMEQGTYCTLSISQYGVSYDRLTNTHGYPTTGFDNQDYLEMMNSTINNIVKQNSKFYFYTSKGVYLIDVNMGSVSKALQYPKI